MCMVDFGAIMMDAHFEGAVAAEEEEEIKNKLNSKRRFCALPSPMYDSHSKPARQALYLNRVH